MVPLARKPLPYLHGLLHTSPLSSPHIPLSPTRSATIAGGLTVAAHRDGTFIDTVVEAARGQPAPPRGPFLARLERQLRLPADGRGTTSEAACRLPLAALPYPS